MLRGHFGFLLLPQFTVIGLSSAIEPLRIANRYVTDKYSWSLLSLDGNPVKDGNGISVNVDAALGDVETYGALFICSDIDPQRFDTPKLRALLNKHARGDTIMGAIDTGAHILARAGLLNGYRVTVHWEILSAFCETFPEIEVTSNLYEIDRKRFTSAGGTAVIDMMLNAVEEQHGREVAVRVAEHCIHGTIRAGSEQQRIGLVSRYAVHHQALLHVIELMEANRDPTAMAETLGAKAGISPRHLSRLFRGHLKTTPSRFYLKMRLERARRLLARTDLSVIDIALTCGFRSHSHFTRVYHAEYGQPPRKLRTDARVTQSLVMDRA
jgi:AraC family transcriptional regulator, carnitine catabolism transcriptional activator